MCTFSQNQIQTPKERVKSMIEAIMQLAAFANLQGVMLDRLIVSKEVFEITGDKFITPYGTVNIMVND